MKWLKIGLGIIALLLILISLAIVAITQWVDPNQYKPQITTAVEQALQRQLIIEGDIALSFFPWLGLQLGQTQLNNPDNFEQQPFAAVQQVQVKVKLLPLLLKQQLQIGQVQLSGAQLLLIQRADGSNNWQDLAQTTEQAADSPESQPSQSNPQLEAIQIEGVNITQSAVVFIDEQQQTSYTLQELNLKTSAISLGQAIEFSLDSTVNASQLPETAHIQLQSKITPNLEQQIFQFQDTQLLIDSKQLPDQLQLTLTDVQLDLAQQVIDIPLFQLHTMQTKINAQFHIQQLFSNPKLVGKLPVQQLNLASLLKTYNVTAPFKTMQLGFDIEASPNQASLHAIQAQINDYPLHIPKLRFDLLSQKLDISEINIEALGAKLRLSEFNAQNFSNPRFNSQLQITDFNIKKWLKQLKLPEQKTSDTKALTQMDLNADIQGDLQSVQLQNLAIKLDQTQIRGQVTLEHFTNPLISLKLEADTLDADRYMPPTDPNAPKAKQPLLPLELLQALNVKGHIKLRKLTVTQMQLQDIKLQLFD